MLRWIAALHFAEGRSAAGPEARVFDTRYCAVNPPSTASAWPTM